MIQVDANFENHNTIVAEASCLWKTEVIAAGSELKVCSLTACDFNPRYNTRQWLCPVGTPEVSWSGTLLRTYSTLSIITFGPRVETLGYGLANLPSTSSGLQTRSPRETNDER